MGSPERYKKRPLVNSAAHYMIHIQLTKVSQGQVEHNILCIIISVVLVILDQPVHLLLVWSALTIIAIGNRLSVWE